MATATASKIKIKPLDDRMVLLPDDPEEVTSGGIVLPDSAREKPQRGTIISTGPGKLLDSGKRGEMSVKKGDVVFYGKYSGTEVEVSGDTYVIIRESDILAIVD